MKLPKSTLQKCLADIARRISRVITREEGTMVIETRTYQVFKKVERHPVVAGIAVEEPPQLNVAGSKPRCRLKHACGGYKWK